MLNLKKEAIPLKEIEIAVGLCPICNSYVFNLQFMQDAITKKQSKWYWCQCGIVWQKDKPESLNLRQIDKDDKKVQAFCEYPVRLYAPLIEELIYGRRILFAGTIAANQVQYFQNRGWVPEHTDNFDSYESSSKLNAIWFYHSFESLLDPISALSRCKELLTEDGILFIASPDTDFLHTRGSSGFRHWKPDLNYLMWNRRAITKQLEFLGFNIIMARQNADMRFPETDDFHIIAQKKFF